VSTTLLATPNIYRVGLGVGIVVNTAPGVYPVTVDEAKDYLRVEVDDENGELDSMVGAATEQVQFDTGLTLISTTFDQWVHRFPCGTSPMRLDRYPLATTSTVTHIKYFDSTDTEQTFSSSSYDVDTAHVPGAVFLKAGYTWPTDLRPYQAGYVRFVAGYGSSGAAVPANLIAAVKLQVKALYWRMPLDVGDQRLYDWYIAGSTVHHVGD
jgi:uncharacterized phiE125 gp8 family phage protein